MISTELSSGNGRGEGALMTAGRKVCTKVLCEPMTAEGALRAAEQEQALVEWFTSLS